MPNLDNLGDHADGALIAESQAQKEVTSNALDNLVSNATQKKLGITISDAAGSPTEADRTLSDDEFFGNHVFKLSGSPSVDFNLTLPAKGSHKFVVDNGTAKVATVTTGSGAVIGVAANKRRELHSDGTDVIATAPEHNVTGGGGGDAATAVVADLDAWFVGSPDEGQLIRRWVIVRGITLPADFSGSQGYAGTAPADGAAVFDLWHDDGTSPTVGVIGTVTFAQGAKTATFANVGSPGAAVTLAAGDFLELRAPAGSPQDSALADISVRLKASGNAFRGALVKLTGDQAITTGTDTDISWAAAVYDTDSFFSLGDPTNLTVPAGVTKIRISANIEWQADATGRRQAQILKDVSSVDGTPGDLRDAVTVAAVPTWQNLKGAAVDVAGGQKFSLRVHHNKGSNLNVVAGGKTWLAIEVAE